MQVAIAFELSSHIPPLSLQILCDFQSLVHIHLSSLYGSGDLQFSILDSYLAPRGKISLDLDASSLRVKICATEGCPELSVSLTSHLTHDFYQPARRQALDDSPVLDDEVSFNTTQFHDRAS